jgi:hypothetical protein
VEKGLERAKKDLREGRAFNADALDVEMRPWMRQWSSERDSHPDRACGDSVEKTGRLWKRCQTP